MMQDALADDDGSNYSIMSSPKICHVGDVAWLDFSSSLLHSQCFLRGVRCRELCIHIRYCFRKVFLRLGSLDLVEYKKIVKKVMLINPFNCSQVLETKDLP